MVRTLDLAKRTAILTAARSIIIRDGYAAAKMSDIASEAGVAPGTLYLYFENKEALASAIGEEFFSRLIPQFGSIIQKIEDPDGIVALVDWAAQIALQERVVLAMSRERNHGPKPKQQARERLVSELAGALGNLASRGVIRQYEDPTTLAQFVLALMRRVIMSYAVYEDENVDRLKAGAIAMLQHALFDDVTLAASRLLERKRQRDI
jgi:AcrR family transcriptional regulator